jgi:hypothetical protein
MTTADSPSNQIQRIIGLLFGSFVTTEKLFVHTVTKNGIGLPIGELHHRLFDCLKTRTYNFSFTIFWTNRGPNLDQTSVMDSDFQ